MNVIDLKKEDFSKFADFLDMGFYRVTQEGKFLECDSKARKLFGIPESADITDYSIVNLYANPAEREMRIKELIKKENKPLTDILSLCIDGENILFFDICWIDKNNNIAGLIREIRESSLLRSLRAIEEMPTGFYHIQYAENDESHEHERLTQCNDTFARILGYEKKEEAIGINIVRLFHPFPDVGEEFFKELHAADKKGKPLLNFLFKTRRIKDKEIIFLSIDTHFVRDSNGKVIGREGTIRDVTDEIDLRKRVEDTKNRLEKTTADINKFIHTFLHPVVKFSGYAELLYQVGSLLKKTIQPEITLFSDGGKLGNRLLTKLIETKDNLPDVTPARGDNFNRGDESDLLGISTFKEELSKIINVFDYSLHTEKSKILLDSTTRDTALWVLDELDKTKFLEQSKLKRLIKEDFMKLLQEVLFSHLIHSVEILKEETNIMKYRVEALRSYIGLQKERKQSLIQSDMRKILEHNIEKFRPILKEKGIDIRYKPSGNLRAEISPSDIDRVVCNLLQNAAKYSKEGNERFVNVIAKEVQPGNKVKISIESYGIPIKKEEIESGNIWKFGYRGEAAYSTDRDGTGVGLADAKDVIKAHKGKIVITSRPAGDESEPPAYKKPYLTMVTIIIPKKAISRKEY